jgi:glycosyltransferase involved in cell wall biosynthesis
MRILFALSGAHRVNRGAEVAFEAIARNLALNGRGDDVVLIGSGPQRPDEPYRYEQAWLVPRERFERFPVGPFVRFPEMWEELTFTPGLLRRFRRRDFDISVTCTFPYTNWVMRRWRRSPRSARHVWITENGDWPAIENGGEARWFGCDGLVCTNPTIYDECKDLWPSTLIPNGVDVHRFHPGPGDRAALGLPADVPIVLMVSAAIHSKRVADGVRAVARLGDAMLVVAGDGILRDELDALGADLLGDRYRRLVVGWQEMPNLYRCADAFVHLSQNESFGNVYVEAMVSGLPCVAHDYPLTRWIYEDHGILVDGEDPDAVAAGLRAALAARQDARDEQVKLGHDRFSWGNIASSYRAFFEDVLARS